jgi:prevent-host-death family protein
MTVLESPGSTDWSVADAKAHLSELLHKVEADGPQVISRRGARIAVVVSFEEWHRKTTRSGSLAEFFAQSPLVGSELEVDRDAGKLRDVTV